MTTPLFFTLQEIARIRSGIKGLKNIKLSTRNTCEALAFLLELQAEALSFIIN